MQLPEWLHSAIEARLEGQSLQPLARARARMSDRYRDQEDRPHSFLDRPEERLAYLASRLPATWTVAVQLLRRLRTHVPELTAPTLLDVGSGPGTLLFAAAEVFPELASATLLERDRNLIALGQLIAALGPDNLKKARWQAAHLEQLETPQPHDLVTSSYVLNELPESRQTQVVQWLWQSTTTALLLIEPGTPAGFARIRAARTQLLGLGAELRAPCPHALACPIPEGDWCHFAQRLERSRLQRYLKGGSESFEDEKFSYLLAVRPGVAGAAAPGRILRHPQQQKGMVRFQLCTPDGLQTQIVSKREESRYKAARKADWGDAWVP
jgi:ribosomal protein RSM22 (predicted rRNA methylase)